MKLAQVLRGKLYHLLTDGWIGKIVGTCMGDIVPGLDGPVILPPGASASMKSAVFFGVYEYPERVLVRKWLPPNHDCIELGASIGVISGEILKKLNIDCRLVAVEALPELAGLARSNLLVLKNIVSDWVILEGAIYYGADKAVFSLGREHVMGRLSELGKTPASVEKEREIRVDSISLAAVLSHLNGDFYSLVMDIEGAEYSLLAHEAHLLERCICLIVELHGIEHRRTEFSKRMQEIGFLLKEQKHSVFVFLRSHGDR